MMQVLLYLDPGSGSMLVQAIAAAVLGIAMFFKNIRMFIMSLFTKRRKDNTNPSK